MSWLRAIFGDGLSAEDATSRDAGDDRWFTGLHGRRSEIDVQVSVQRARQVPVIRSCLSLLAGSVAGLEVGVFRRVDRGQVQRQDTHPVARLMRDPNPRMTGFDLIFQMVDDLCSEGDFYGELMVDLAGNVQQVWRLEPRNVQVEELPDRSRRYRVHERNGQQRILLEEEVWHIAMPPFIDGIRGTSPILDDGREAVAVAIALQRYANILFTNDATPPYAMVMDGQFKDQASRENMLTALAKWAGGRNRHKPGLFEYGMKPHRMGLTAEEAQFLETRKELWVDLARLWRVPPHKVGILDKATFSNIEHQSLEFVIDTLRPILELIERSVAKVLIDEPDVFFEFNVESLLRGDLKSRYEAYAVGRQWGWLSVNDILRSEHKNEIGPAGDRYVEPLNMVPVGTGADGRERDQRAAIDRSIAFLRESTARNGGRPRLEIVQDAA